VGTDTGQIYAYKLKPSTARLSLGLTPVSGSPFSVPNATYIFSLGAAYTYLYVGETMSSGPQVYGYDPAQQRYADAGESNSQPDSKYVSGSAVFSPLPVATTATVLTRTRELGTEN
jgi:hypothetical protein